MARLSAQQRVNLTVLVAALGYFVDVFDLQLFSMVRVNSLASLGLSGSDVTSTGILLQNWQMAGLLLGGILWGIYGDKKGRLSILFGTILLYSLGNIANAFVTTVPAYAAARFISGLGLAGEIGAGVTLASELLPKTTRGYGTALIFCCGGMGPLAAGFVAYASDWRTSYIIGGILGLGLLILRVSVRESGMFSEIQKQAHISRGHFLMLFNNRKRLLRYLMCIGCGIPAWILLGVITVFAPEIGRALNISEPLKASTAVMAYFAGFMFGALLIGLLSQIFKNRKIVMLAFIVGLAITCAILLMSKEISAQIFYGLIGIGGFFCGYWNLFATTTAEQFGTNLRTTAATTVPNFARGSIIIDTFLLSLFKPSLGFLGGVSAVTILGFMVAFLALWRLPETFGRDLDFVER